MAVYIVEDNPDVCEFVTFLLSTMGHTVFHFQCPVEALHHMQADGASPALLISDYNLPEITGYELYQQATAAHPTLRSIIISGRDVQDKIGGLPFLQKPFRPEVLIELVKTLHPSYR